MKKLLSLILAIAMTLTLIPAAFAAEGEETAAENFTIKYDVGGALYKIGAWHLNVKDTTKPIDMTYGVTNGFFKYSEKSSYSGKWSTDTSNYRLYPYTTTKEKPETYSIAARQTNYITFEVYVPVAGTYMMSVDRGAYTPSNSTMEVYYKLGKVTDSYNYKTDTQLLGTYNFKNGEKNLTVTNDVQNEGETVKQPAEFFVPEPGYYTVTYYVNNSEGYRSTLGNFYLISGDGNGAALMPYYSGETALEVGNTASLKGYKSSDALETAVSYSVTGDAVSVDEETGTITAKKAGTATVTMTATDASITTAKTYSVDITVEDAAASYTVAYGTNINGTISVQGTGITRGTDVTVTAPEISGKIFRHWVLGTEENGTVVSTKAEHTFPLMTNTYLTAVYTDKPAEGAKLVEFFNWNGDYLSQSVLGENNSYTAPTPSLIGFSFNNAWLVDENKYLSDMTEFGEVTRAVAEFTPVGSYNVNGTEYTYDAEVTKTADQEMAWYRDDVLVGYGKEYTYNVWNTVSAITSKAFTAKAPVVVLDAHIKEGNACMIEYDNGGKTIKEVGILFGDSDARVDSADSKATSQWNEAHGQFTAKPRTAGTATHARGYIIYADGEDFRVIYTDAIALANAD